MTDKSILNEGLDYHDMEGQLEPRITVDEYAAKMGKDHEIVTVTFIVKSKQAGKDLVDWLERGYDWVLDASLSEGEIEIGKYLVFMEMNRRSTAPTRILDILRDLETITALKLTEWTIEVDDEEYEPEEDILRQVIICNPNVYKVEKEKEGELNEMRQIAQLENKDIYTEDAYLRSIKTMAGL